MIYALCIWGAIALSAVIACAVASWLIRWWIRYHQMQERVNRKFWNKGMIISDNGDITKEEFWDAIVAHEGGTLEPSEQHRYYLAGAVAEHRQRESGSTLLPLSEEFAEARALPVEAIDRNLLIRVGIVALAMENIQREG